MKVLKFFRFFHKALDMDGAQSILSKKPHGTFLFRYGKERGTLCLSAVDGNDVIHCRISVSEDGFKFEEKFHPSLQSIVQNYPKLLKYPLIRPSQKPLN
jgi:hypothetical protein